MKAKCTTCTRSLHEEVNNLIQRTLKTEEITSKTDGKKPDGLSLIPSSQHLRYAAKQKKSHYVYLREPFIFVPVDLERLGVIVIGELCLDLMEKIENKISVS